MVELGWQDVEHDGGAWRIAAEGGALLVNPGQPIPPSVSAIHHIVDEDVAGAPSWQAAAPGILAPPDRPLAALAAHRTAFERRWCTDTLTGGLPWICTYKCALRLWPEAPTHSNQGLRYWRRPVGLDRARGLPAHRAGPDAYVTAHHLRDLLAMASPEQLVAWTAEPALLARVPFGPSKGKRWTEVEAGFLDWVLARRFDADVLFTARQERQRRDGGGTTGAIPEPGPEPGRLL